MECENILVDPIGFMLAFGGKKPDAWQCRVLRDRGKRVSIRAGRQVGKSTTIAFKVLHRAIMIPNSEILILAPTQRQSSLLFSKIWDIINSNNVLHCLVVKDTLTAIELRNGSGIYCLPAGRTGEMNEKR